MACSVHWRDDITDITANLGMHTFNSQQAHRQGGCRGVHMHPPFGLKIINSSMQMYAKWSL